MPVAHLNDTELFYLEMGVGHPCLVMHGGLGMDHTYLHPWLDPLADTMHLVYYDHRGNGRSGRPPIETLTLAQFAADADALRAHLGLEKVALIGQSWGGLIAFEYALQYSDRSSHLILADSLAAFNYVEQVTSNARRKGATEEMLALLESPPPTVDAEFRQVFETIAPLYFHIFDPDLANRLFGQTVWSASAAARGEQLMAECNYLPRLGEIHTPTLILVGRDDFITPPSHAQAMHAGLPNSELVILENSGHLTHAEEPVAFCAAIRSWIRGIT